LGKVLKFGSPDGYIPPFECGADGDGTVIT